MVLGFKVIQAADFESALTFYGKSHLAALKKAILQYLSKNAIWYSISRLFGPLISNPLFLFAAEAFLQPYKGKIST